MATGPGILNADIWFNGQLAFANQLRETGQDVNTLGFNGQETTTPLAILVVPFSGAERATGPIVRTIVREPGQITQDLSQAWFQLVHLFPKFIDFGQILSTVVVQIEIYNAFYRTDIPLNTITNNAGAGLGFNPAPPSLPFTILYQDGLVLTVEATQDGNPIFDSTIDFALSIYTLTLPVSGLRVVVFPYAPEAPLVERLNFLTDVLPKVDGTEQRINLRKAPRQSFDMRIIREGSLERSVIENLLFEWQARAFGVPVWYEPTELTANVLVGDTTINVDSTRYADYRVGDLMIILESESKYDAQEVAEVNPRSLILASPTLNAYNRGVRVYPLRVCLTEREVAGSRMQNEAAEYFFRFNVLSNNVLLGNTGAFNTFNGKVLLDDPNFVPDNQLQRTAEMEIIVLDSATGVFSNATPWAKGKNTSFKGWAISGSRKKLWEVRQLLHALRGRQISFYIPTFQKEMIPTQQLTIGTTGLQISNVGYTKYAKSRSTKNIVRLTFADTTKLIRTINSSAEAGAVENLVVSSTWPSTVPIANIAKIELLELVRLDADEIRIEHASCLGDAQLVVPVRTVFD